MKKILLLLAFICSVGQAQIIQHNIPDDGWAHVPLQFGFPLHGRVFTDSFMFSNGVVGFGSVTNGWCCTGYDLTFSRGQHLNYSILGLQTDLINYGSGRFRTEGTTQYQRYHWENISEYGVPDNLNTFGIEIRPSGFIGMYYKKVNISNWRPVTSGITGDTDQGQYTQFYHGPGFNTTTPYSYEVNSTGNQCLVDPLSSPTCPGYQQAYLNQQCSINPLYDSSCAGYAQAYFTQQCSLDPLYDTNCSGYSQAYFNQQCRSNALFDRTCPGYAEAYALANVVAAPTVVVSAPAVQVSTTGTVSVETPVVSDPVVNEVITRPVSNNATNTTNNVQTNTTNQQAAEPKQEKKQDTKQVPKQTATAQNEIPTQTIPQPVYEYKAPIILDLAYQKMVKKPIQDNNRAMYNLIMNSQIKHEEMVNEQYRK